MTTGPKKTVSIIMPLELYTQIKQLSLETSRTVPAYIRQVLKVHLRQQEDARKTEKGG